MSRPNSYTETLGDYLCMLVGSCTLSLDAILRDREDLPHASTVYRWLAAHPEFRERYIEAKEQQAEILADEIIEIADDSSHDLLRRPDGTWVTNHGALQRSKLRIDARKWRAAQLRSKKHGRGAEAEKTVETEEVGGQRSEVETALPPSTAGGPSVPASPIPAAESEVPAMMKSGDHENCDVRATETPSIGGRAERPREPQSGCGESRSAAGIGHHEDHEDHAASPQPRSVSIHGSHSSHETYRSHPPHPEHAPSVPGPTAGSSPTPGPVSEPSPFIPLDPIKAQLFQQWLRHHNPSNRPLRLADWPLLSPVDGTSFLTIREFMERIMEQKAQAGRYSL